MFEPHDHIIGDVFLHEQTRTGAANMALVEEDPVDYSLDRFVDGGVVEDDVGGFAAELESCPFACACDGAGDGFAHLR